MEKLNFKSIMTSFMVKSMLNPSNKSFYIGSLTLETLNRVIDGDSEMAEVIFTAFGIAQARYLAELEENACLIESDRAYDIQHTCPECYAQGYVTGCACPNCDYVEC